MAQRIFFSDLAIAQLRNIDQVTAIRVLNALARLMETGEGDVKMLQGTTMPELRLRVGDYRVRYHTQGTLFMIHSIFHRREAYR